MALTKCMPQLNLFDLTRSPSLLIIYFLVGLGVCKRKAGALPLEPHLQSILLWLFWKWGPENYLMGWPHIMILLISASQGTSITGVSPWRPAQVTFISYHTDFLNLHLCSKLLT
jgi:hypothetical protein